MKIPASVVFTAFVLILSAASPAAAQPAQQASSPGLSSPDSSNVLDLSAYRGQVVYLDFWASWCAPCKQSFPWMNALHTRYGDRGLRVVTVNVDRKHEAAQAFLEKNPALFRVVFDPEGELAKAFKLEAMPMSFLYDAEGKLVHQQLGFSEKESEVLEQTIIHLLKEAHGS